MSDLNKLSREELLDLLKDVHDANPDQPYHPDSLMAMAVADPVEARRIAKAMQPPAVKVIKFIVLSIFGGLFLLLAVALLREWVLV